MTVSIVQVPIKDLTLLDRNPRKITKEQMNNLCKSIQCDPDFLKNRPVLVNEKDGKLIVYAGNQRVRAAQKLKWKDIPCIIERDLPEEIVKQRIIKDNKTFGEFDFDILANEWEIYVLLDSGFIADEIIGMAQDIESIQSEIEQENDKKKLKMCPSCGHEF